MSMLKKCCKCKKEFPATAEYFYRVKSRPDGFGLKMLKFYKKL